MPPPIPSKQAYTINIDSLDILTPNKSVVTRVYAGNGLLESHRTGFDQGSGNVTLSLSPSGVASGDYSSVVVDIYGRVVGGDSRKSVVFTEDLQSGKLWFEDVRISNLNLDSLNLTSNVIVPLGNGGLGYRGRPSGEVLVGNGDSYTWRKLSVNDIEGVSDLLRFDSKLDCLNVEKLQLPISHGSVLTMRDGFVSPLGYTPEDSAMRGVAGGYASLDDYGILDMKHIPAFAFGNVHTCGDLETMLNLTDAKRGDVCIRTDGEAATFVLAATPGSNENNWKPVVFRHSLAGAMLLQTKSRQPGGFWVALNSRCDMELRVGSALEFGEIVPEVRSNKLYRANKALMYGDENVVLSEELKQYLRADEQSHNFKNLLVDDLGVNSFQLQGSSLSIDVLGRLLVNNEVYAKYSETVTTTGDQRISGVKSFENVMLTQAQVGTLVFNTYKLSERDGTVVLDSANGSVLVITEGKVSINSTVYVPGLVLEEGNVLRYGFSRNQEDLYFNSLLVPNVVEGFLNVEKGFRCYNKQVVGRQQPAISSLVDNSGGSASATLQNLKTCRAVEGVVPSSVQTIVDTGDSNVNNVLNLLGSRYNDVVNDVTSLQNAIASLNAKLNQILASNREHGLIAT